MRLRSVTIEHFKNLRDLKIYFDESSPYTVLVGENGTGKSNLIEALALIFRNLDLDLKSPFSYELTYECRGHNVEVCATEGKYPRLRVKHSGDEDYAKLPRKHFMEEVDGRPAYRPAFVFGYYSGPSDRLSSIFEKHRERYYSWIIQSPSRRGKKVTDPNALRRLFYAQNLHGQFALIAFFMAASMGSDDDRTFLREHLQIQGLDSVLFALKRPPWAQTRTEGDARFWHAVGEVQEFLDRLYDQALLPLRMGRRIPVDLARNPTIENLYLYLPTPADLEVVYKTYGDQYSFFTALESMHLSKLLSEVRTRVRMTPAGGGGEVTYRELSEGEQQLLLVLGLLKFTARDEALFLLDEPDTHLNPVWSTQYLTFLNRFIRGRNTCHIVMSSHDPLVFAGLERSEVRIFRRAADGEAVVEAPDQDPRGMGVAAILTSDLFRLRSTLDPETQARLDRQRTLSSQEELSGEEEAELRELKLALSKLGFARTTRDPLYEQFLNAWAEREDPAWSRTVTLTPEQQQERELLAQEIVEVLRREPERP